MLLKSKKDMKKKYVVLNIEIVRKIPSNVSKTFLIECIVKFYKLETTVSLDNKYIKNQEECLQKFKVDMVQKMLNAFNILE